MNFCVSRTEISYSSSHTLFLVFCHAKTQMPILNMILIIFYLPTRKYFPFWCVCESVILCFFFCFLSSSVFSCRQLFLLLVNVWVHCKVPEIVLYIHKFFHFTMSKLRLRRDSTCIHFQRSCKDLNDFTPKNECFGDICVTFWYITYAKPKCLGPMVLAHSSVIFSFFSQTQLACLLACLCYYSIFLFLWVSRGGWEMEFMSVTEI